MKTLSKKTTRFSDDMRQIFVKAFGKGEDMTRLCREHNDPLLHIDNKPVLNLIQDEFVSIFNRNSNRHIITVKQAFRFGTYCRLRLPNLIALVLKAEWEKYLSDIPGIQDRLSVSSNDDAAEFLSGFKPDPGKIFSLFKEDISISSYRISYSIADFYISDLMINYDFRIANEEVSELFPDKEISEENLLLNKSPEQKESYIRLKELWLIKSTELDEMLMYLERRKRLNLGLENKYFSLFGNLEADRSKVAYRLEKYRIILELMDENQKLSLRKLLELAENRLTEAKRIHCEIRNKITRSMNRIDFTFTDTHGNTVTEEFKNSYIQECKKLLKKLFFLLHTDTCPNYTDLPGNKKAEINRLWLKLMKSTKEDIYSFSPSMLLYSLPDYEQLKSIYLRACEILGIDPDSFETGNRLEFIIKKGSSIESVIGFLKSETEQLEFHLARLELIQNEYSNEEQTNIYRKAMEDINGHAERLKNEISDVRIQILDLKSQISEELAKIAQ